MAIRPIDIQTSILGSQGVSEARERQQNLENVHQNNPHGEIEDMDRKMLEEVNKAETDNDIDPDREKENDNEQEAAEAKSEEEDGSSSSKQKPAISDGIRGRKFDFKA